MFGALRYFINLRQCLLLYVDEDNQYEYGNSQLCQRVFGIVKKIRGTKFSQLPASFDPNSAEVEHAWNSLGKRTVKLYGVNLVSETIFTYE